MAECTFAFDGQHHYAPRQWGDRNQGTPREVLACRCGEKCPPELAPAVEAALAAVEQYRAHQAALAQRFARQVAAGDFGGRGQSRLL
jgi:hypothetical protein